MFSSIIMQYCGNINYGFFSWQGFPGVDHEGHQDSAVMAFLFWKSNNRAPFATNFFTKQLY